MVDYKVKDIRLADEGRRLIEWAETLMPVLMSIRRRLKEKKPLEGLKIAACLHVTKETAVLVRTLRSGGAQVSLAASNPLSTQDEVAAALADEGFRVYAWRGENKEEYFWCIRKILEVEPSIVLDDGGDLHVLVHREFPDLAERILGGTEETTTGIVRLRSMEREGVLKYPVIAVNNALTKFLFDNRYGTGQSSIDGIIRATNILIAGKRVVVAGYGWVGRGIAMRARGMGAHVIVTEVNPIRALEAFMDGFEVMSMEEAARIGDVFITATGNIKVIDRQHIELMKDGAILANAGHFNVEINIDALESLASSKRIVRRNVEEYVLKDGRRIYLLAEGRLVNLVAAEGHPSEVMDLSFSNQALSVEYLKKSSGLLSAKLHNVPSEIDEMVAKIKLESLGIKIDELTEEQRKYLESWII